MEWRPCTRTESIPLTEYCPIFRVPGGEVAPCARMPVFPQLLSQFLALHLLKFIRDDYENNRHAFALFAR
jgi:hypothetical protein